jgi:hypothetical protein
VDVELDRLSVIFGEHKTVSLRMLRWFSVARRVRVLRKVARCRFGVSHRLTKCYTLRHSAHEPYNSRESEHYMPTAKRKGGSTKRAFVLSLPLDMPAKEVVERAAKAGMKLKDSYIYVVRSNSRLRRGGSVRAASGGATAASGSTESQFRRLALELGLGRSKDLLNETEKKVAALIAGK